VGPQFYFEQPDCLIESSGFLHNIMIFLQDLGEKPTGAFPSSHVGICIICMYIIFKYSRKTFYMLIPVSAILICSTVYIKAHYLIDVFGGFVSVPVYYWISNRIQKIKFLK
jgi:membrane-associated phospholipid phosphatase